MRCSGRKKSTPEHTRALHYKLKTHEAQTRYTAAPLFTLRARQRGQQDQPPRVPDGSKDRGPMLNPAALLWLNKRSRGKVEVPLFPFRRASRVWTRGALRNTIFGLYSLDWEGSISVASVLEKMRRWLCPRKVQRAGRADAVKLWASPATKYTTHRMVNIAPTIHWQVLVVAWPR